MREWFEIMIRHTETERRNPIYFIRFEDLNKDMEGPTRGLLEYLLDIESLEGTNAEKRLQEFCSKGKEATKVYKTKATTGVANAHVHRYSEE